MTKWAGENYDRDMAAAEVAAEASKLHAAQEKEEMLQHEIEQEKAVLEEDRLITQDVYRMMRQIGLIPGVNAPLSEYEEKQKKAREDKVIEEQRAMLASRQRTQQQSRARSKRALGGSKVAADLATELAAVNRTVSVPDMSTDTSAIMALESSNDESLTDMKSLFAEDLTTKASPRSAKSVYLCLQEDIDLKRMHPRARRATNPFNHDLMAMRNIEVLKAHMIGERGALSLASVRSVRVRACAYMCVYVLMISSTEREGGGRNREGGDLITTPCAFCPFLL